jgi:hypothetical protein
MFATIYKKKLAFNIIWNMKSTKTCADSNNEIDAFTDSIIKRISNEKYILENINYYHLYNNIMLVLLYNIENNFSYQKFLTNKFRKNNMILLKKYRGPISNYYDRILDETDSIIDQPIVTCIRNWNLDTTSSYIYYEILKNSLFLKHFDIKYLVIKINYGNFKNWFIVTNTYRNKLYIKKHIDSKSSYKYISLSGCNNVNYNCKKCVLNTYNKICSLL